MAVINDHFLFFSRAISETHILLEADESAHMIAVLRAREGTPVRITDGAGMYYNCAVDSVMKKSAACRILSREAAPVSRVSIDVVVGLPDKDAFETMLELLVPLGVRSVTPVEMECCQKKWWDRKWDDCMDRFERKTIAALKQSMGARLPAIASPVSFREALATERTLLLHADCGGAPLHTFVLPKRPDLLQVTVVIGPPGGFSASELALLGDAQSVAIGLAPLRLRTELAAAVMVGQLQGLLLE